MNVVNDNIENQNPDPYAGIIRAIRGEFEEVPIRHKLDMALINMQRQPEEQDYEYAHRMFRIGLDIYNEKYASSLTELTGSPELVGYEAQLEFMTVDLMERETPNVILLGEAGVGKTQTVSKWIYNRKEAGDNQFMVQLNIELMGALPLSVMVSRFKTLLSDLAYMREKISEKTKFKLAIFIDEVHKLTLYPADSPASPLVEAMKEDLARGTLPFIGATTASEFNQKMANIEAIERRFEQVIIQKPTTMEVVKIISMRAKRWSEKPDGHRPVNISHNILKNIVELSGANMPGTVDPARSLKIMQRAIAQAEYRGADNVEFIDVEKAFQQSGVELKSSVTASHVETIIKKRIKGQPLAIEAVLRAVRNSFYFPPKPNQPFMALLFVGTTGVGKTELAKALAEAYYGSEDYVVTVNGGDYSRPEDVEALKIFIGDKFAVNQRQLLLLDEIEKMDRTVVLSLMRLIDEGKTYDRNGVERSLKRSIIIGTSNLGATIFDTMKTTLQLEKYEDPNTLTPELKQAFADKELDLRDRLIQGDERRDNGFKAEFLERFTEIVAFMPLTRVTLLEIVRMKLDSYIRDMKTFFGVTVSLPPVIDWRKRKSNTMHYVADPVSLYFVLDVMGTKSSTAGVRMIARWIYKDIGDEISKILTERPETKAFNISTNGKASFETNEVLNAGQVVIESADQFSTVADTKTTTNGGVKW